MSEDRKGEVNPRHKPEQHSHFLPVFETPTKQLPGSTSALLRFSSPSFSTSITHTPDTMPGLARTLISAALVLVGYMYSPSGVLASPTATMLLAPRQACGEGTQHLCYGQPDGTPQNIDPEDVTYLASKIRFEARKAASANPDSTLPVYFNMPANAEFQCEEWSIQREASVLILVKHTSARLNSTVLALDIANTLDGGENATDEQRAKSLLGCGTNGGQMGLVFDASNPAYTGETYKSWKTTPSGLVIKVVRAP